jgi:hypothetical protein
VLSLTYEFVGFWFFYLVTYCQICSAPENDSSLLSKRRVCIISDDGKSRTTNYTPYPDEGGINFLRKDRSISLHSL